MRYWITDKDETPQRFPLQRLFRQVLKVTGTKSDVCNVLRARGGYGRRVRELEQESDVVDIVAVPMSELDELCAGTEEWFYDLEGEIPGTDVRFGLHDSTALFVEGDQQVCEAVAAAFTNHRPATGG